HAKGNTLFYFDPPYRPLNGTSNFKDYAKEPFNDEEQVRLKNFCDKIHNSGFKFLLSNSDSKDENEGINFFESLYENYQIERVWAKRSINSVANKRGKLTEIVIRNYQSTKQNP
ncbi:MAG: DNA adenine methylase, partial [Sodaliphilus sp.]